MPHVKLFTSKIIEDKEERRERALSLLNISMDVFMLQLDVEVRQVNGPYHNYLPPEKQGSLERVVYTANIIYNQTKPSK